MEEVKQSWYNKLIAYLRECRRVLTVTKKPTSEEFKAIVKVSALGMAVIGLIGFIIQMIKTYFF